MKRNLMATLLLSQGVRMVLGGDEMGRTQAGNNNAYCQDNEISWVHWNLSQRDQRLLAFTRRCIDIFRSNPILRRRSFFTGRPMSHGAGGKDVTWIRPDGREMTEEDWADPNNQILGMLIDGTATDEVDERGRPVFGDTVLLLLNGGPRSRFFELPKLEEPGMWYEAINTARPDVSSRALKNRGVNLVSHSLHLLRYGATDTPQASS
jgi:glycogen operon protein